MIDKVVEFFVEVGVPMYGVVLNVEKIYDKEKDAVITGYLVEDKLGRLYHVPYYKLLRVMRPQEDLHKESAGDILEKSGIKAKKGDVIEYTAETAPNLNVEPLPFELQ